MPVWARQRDMRRVAETVHAVERQVRTRPERGRQTHRRRFRDVHAAFRIGKTDGSGVSARSGTTPGSGTVQFYRRSAAGALEATEEDTVTAYNLSTVEVASNTYVGVGFAAGGWWVVPIRQEATRVRGQLTAACTGGAFTMDNLIGLNGYISGTSLSGCQNPYSMEGDDNGAVSVEWNAEDEQWEAYQMECPS